MLDDLDAVPWGSLGTGVHDTAEDVPRLLREMAFGEEEAAQQAFFELFQFICHQGDVYEATPYAVPFLVEIATAGAGVSASVRAHVIATLPTIARGSQYPRYDPARAAVAAHLPALLNLLDDDTPAVRVGVAVLAVEFPDEASPAVERMDQLRSEAPPGPAADLFRLAHAVATKQVTPDLLDEVAGLHWNVREYLEEEREAQASLEHQAAVVAHELLGPAFDQLKG